MSALALAAYEPPYTYKDYCAMDDDVRREIIDGVIYNMAAPTTTHQRVMAIISTRLENFLAGKKCRMFFSPIDVRLDYDKGDYTVVQPDIIVVCDRSKIDKHGIKGAPDLVVEVLSPSSHQMDRIRKQKKYHKSGVREYWIVDPEHKIVQTFIYEGDKTYTNSYSESDTIQVQVLPGCEVDLSNVFEDDLLDDNLLDEE